MKKRLVVSDTTPLYPPHWGGPVRIWNLFCELPIDKFFVDFVGIHREVKDKYSVRKCSANVREFLVPFPRIYKLWEPIHLRCFAQRISFDLFHYLFVFMIKGMREVFDSLQKDVLVSSHPWSSVFMQKQQGQMFIYDAHNCEYLLMKQISKELWLGRLISKCVKFIERSASNKSDAIFVCSEKEKQDFQSIYGIDENKIHIIPNATDIFPLPLKEEKEQAKYDLGAGGRKAILFIGAYYKPNNVAAKYIVEDLALKLPNHAFFIVGSVRDFLEGIQIPANVILLGIVDKEILRKVLVASDVAINPMLSGGGTNIKMLDYFGAGLPTVTTMCGARGILGEDKKHFFVADINAFDISIEKILLDMTFYNCLSENAYSLASNSYSWASCRSKIVKVIDDFYTINNDSKMVKK